MFVLLLQPTRYTCIAYAGVNNYDNLAQELMLYQSDWKLWRVVNTQFMSSCVERAAFNLRHDQRLHVQNYRVAQKSNPLPIELSKHRIN